MATGMALRECFISLKLQRPQANNVIWPRIDQKSCLKSMLSIGLNVIVIEPKIVEKGLVTDIDAVEAKIEELGADNILVRVSNRRISIAPSSISRAPFTVDDLP